MRVVALVALAILPTVFGFGGFQSSGSNFVPQSIGGPCRTQDDCAEGVCKDSDGTLWAAFAKFVCQFDVESGDGSIHLAQFDSEGNLVGEDGGGAADDDIGNYMYDVNKLWPQSATIRWCLLTDTLPSSMSAADARTAIKMGADDWGQYINLKIEETTDCSNRETLRISADPTLLCSAYVGPGWMKAGILGTDLPAMMLGQACWSHGIILHEWGHVLGLMHEHQSPNFPYEIDYAKTGYSQQAFDANLKKETMRQSLKVSEYDPDSIMIYAIPAHYIKNPPAGFTGTKKNNMLSPIDIRGAREMYPGGGTPCVDSSGARITCPTGITGTGTAITTTSTSTSTTTRTCPYEGNGECDAPLYCPAGTDVADCAGVPISQTCRFEGDGTCDVPLRCPVGTDTQDCWRAASCEYENDRMCDVPDICPPGTDLADCVGQPAAYMPPTGCNFSGDGICDEPLFCAPNTDADCRTPQTPVQWCHSSGDGTCDESYGGCPPGTDSDCPGYTG